MIIEYENNDLIVINKPAGLPVYSTKKHEQEDSVLSWLINHYPEIKNVGDKERPGIVHRLDKQTSGLLVLAKNTTSFDYLKKLFASRDISKEYLALVYGELPRHGIIEKPLTKIGQEGRSRVRVDEKGKPAVTEYWTMRYFTLPQPLPFSRRSQGYYGEVGSREGNKKGVSSPLPARRSTGEGGVGEDKGEGAIDTFTLVKIKLHTGRTHQIRVHFSHLKHPVMGDDLYGKPNSLKLKDILPRQFLHASRLEFQLMDGTWLGVESDLPEDLKEVLTQLNKLAT